MKKVEMTPAFAAALKGYLAVLNAGIRAGYGETMPEYGNFLVPEEGLRYVRVWSRDQREDDAGARGSAYSFVDKTNGDVLKPDGWKKPAKHARGNILDGSWVDYAGPYGAGGYGFLGFTTEVKTTVKALLVAGKNDEAETLLRTTVAAATAKRKPNKLEEALADNRSAL